MESLLVANRGEIACRIVRTARRMGIRTIAVFSDADAAALHVREADEAVRIGPAPARESYLNIPRLLEAARTMGARAVHPGYGFLSENAHFAQACVEAGLVFVGPPPTAIAAMGSKIVAKARMRFVGVPVLPGYEGERQDLAHLRSEAQRLGLPLIIKPAAGGGGKGMRIVTDETGIEDALTGARRLAQSAFGDGSLLLERFLPAPRHIEVQVFADTHGNFVHLGDRDCSIQRRHQKLIEEAPAPGLPEDVRMRLRAAALIVAREIGYVSAGTVEFLFDGREFYFMEMNTRLQVEHTVTEAVTGLDLVEWQLRIAEGECLPLEQSQVRLTGHAIEARVCAEDPERDFLPSAGTLHLMQWPSGESVRVDAGFATGDTVPESYDSLLGKVIAYAPSRGEAARRLAAALRRTYCAGVRTNERWLARILETPEFLAATHSIAYLQSHGPRLSEAKGPTHASDAFASGSKAPQSPPQEISHDSTESDHRRPRREISRGSRAIFDHGRKTSDVRAIALAALALHGPPASSTRSPWEATDGFTPNLFAQVDLLFKTAAGRQRVRIEFENGSPVAVVVHSPDEEPGNGESTGPGSAGAIRMTVAGRSSSEGGITATLDGVHLHARFLAIGRTVHLWLSTAHEVYTLEDPREIEFTAQASEGSLTTPLPGVVTAVPVQVGQTVSKGDVLMVIEAMKMEHAITAPFDGAVHVIHFAVGERVPEGSELLELTAVAAVAADGVSQPGTAPDGAEAGPEKE